MDFAVLQLYEESFLAGEMTAEQVVHILGGTKLPRFLPLPLDPEFLNLIVGQVHFDGEEKQTPRKEPSSLGDVVLRAEQMRDKPTTRLYLEAFDREVLGKPSGLRRPRSCLVLETAEEVLGGALWYYVTHQRLGPQLYIDRLYVDPKYRGRSYGESLVKRVMGLEEDTCTHVQLVAPESVIGFYRRLQFRVLQTSRDEELGGKKFALMSRPL